MNVLKILIIENELLVALDIRVTLESAGHSVTGIARDAKEAQRLVRDDPPDLAIVDITLDKRDKSGIEIMQILLTQHWMPFIYLTSHDDDITMEKASATQPSAYLLKPYRPEELLIQIKLAHSNFTRLTSPSQYSPSDSLFLPFDNGHEQVSAKNILFLEAKGSCVNVHMLGYKKPRMIGMTLGNLAQHFPTLNFFRLSRSLFINLDHLKRIERTTIQLGEERLAVDISEANRKELLKRIRVVRTK
ncbi:response regulator [Salmonirosea aquatica]|uniref:Response regulator n=1 Tax=Salmonirosea aquatica TaxID=2654236 RepID=A0A7C9BJC9_9BACT|nr:response regulator [Cytophagaceae bacterium SJW1-29]